MAAACNPFWCYITLNFLLNNFSPTILPVIVVVIVLRTDTTEKNIFFKPLRVTSISVTIKLPPNWCKVTFNFCSVCYNLSEMFSFLSLNMDFVRANSANPDEMTHHVATFHLGLPCSMKYPIRGFWYTKGIQRLIISHIWVQKLPCFTTDQIRYSFYCVSVK